MSYVRRILFMITVVNSPRNVATSQLSWYAIRTKSNHERVAAAALARKGFEQYFPVVPARRQWSDRVVERDLPLFAGYLFCRFELKYWLAVIQSPGAVSVVGFGNQPAPIEDSEIESIRRVATSGHRTRPCAFCSEGQRVRLNRGPLEGLEGYVIRSKNEWRVIVSVTLLQRSISTEVDYDAIALIKPRQQRTDSGSSPLRHKYVRIRRSV